MKIDLSKVKEIIIKNKSKEIIHNANILQVALINYSNSDKILEIVIDEN